MRHDGLDAFDRINDVRAGLLEDLQQNAGVAVLPGDLLIVFRSVDGHADVADTHRGALYIGDDDVVPGRRLHELVVVIDGEVVQRAVEGSLRRIDRRIGDDAGDVFQLDSHRGDFFRIHLHPHGRLLLATDGDLGDTGKFARSAAPGRFRRSPSTVVTGSTLELTEYIRIGRVGRIDLLEIGRGGQVLGQLGRRAA